MGHFDPIIPSWVSFFCLYNQEILMTVGEENSFGVDMSSHPESEV